MEKEFFGKLTFDTETANEKLKAVIEAHEKFMQALYEYEHSVDYNNIKLEVKG